MFAKSVKKIGFGYPMTMGGFNDRLVAFFRK